MSRLIWFFSFFFLCFPLFALESNLLRENRDESQFEQPAGKTKKDQKSVFQNNTEEFELELISSQTQVKKGSAFLVGIRIKLPEDWHSYWSFAGDFGQAPQIQWRPIENVKIKSLPFPAPERKSFSINGKQSYSFIYETELLIPFEVFIEKNYEKDHLPLFADLKWFVCKELCFSKEASFQLDLKLDKFFETNPEVKRIFDFWEPLFPKELNLKSHFEVKGKKQIIYFSFEEEIECLDLFPEKNVDFSTAPPVLLNQSLYSCVFQVEKSSSSLPKISGLIVYSQQGEKRSALFQSYRHKGLGIFWFILMAFLGGLLLNIMPCVLPIIFLKFYNTLELKHLPQRKILFLNLSYALGVIASFLFLAFIIFISKQTGESLGWGFHLQSPIFVTFLALLFTLMAFYFLNVISFSMPKVSLFFKDEKLLSHFATGVLSTTAASPCTVPFMVSAVGFAFSRSYIEIFVIFFFLGLGLSSPYIALSFFPKVLKYIPSPGRWTEILKQLFSIPLFLTALWLIQILYLQVDLKAFWISLMAFPLLFLWIVLQKVIKKSSIKTVLTLVFVCLLIFLFIGQKSLNRSSEKTHLSKPIQKTAFLDSNWFTFDEQRLLLDKQRGKNIFMAFGAEWCLTCKLNERVFKKQEFKELVRKNQIQLYYGDWTNQTPEITQFLESYAQQGVPFYIFFKGEEKLFIFPSLLFPETFLQDLEEWSK